MSDQKDPDLLLLEVLTKMSVQLANIGLDLHRISQRLGKDKFIVPEERYHFEHYTHNHLHVGHKGPHVH